MILNSTFSKYKYKICNLFYTFCQDHEWEIVENESPEGSPVYINSLESGFWFKFKELHHRMGFMMNRIGTHKDQNIGGLDALKWPLNLISQKFCPESPRATMVGNPAIYAINIVCVILFLTLVFLKKLTRYFITTYICIRKL